MSLATHLLVSTSDRYDLEWEHEALSAIPDFAFELRGGQVRSSAEILELARDADAVLLSSREVLGRKEMEQLSRCKVIARYAVGLDDLDLDAAADNGIVVTHYPMYCTNEVADHAVALILALNRRIVQFDRDLHAGAWVQHKHHMDQLSRGTIPPLREMTIGIIGIGRIGTEVAKRLAAFGCRVIAHDPFVSDVDVRTSGAAPVALNELLASSDIVTLHCPLTPGTHHLINAEALARMRPGAMLVNTARGRVVDLDALAAAVKSGALGGAALDVVHPEPLPLDSPLYGLEDVILTPHAAYYSERSVEVIRRETLMAAVDVLLGRRPKVVANPAVLERVELSAPR